MHIRSPSVLRHPLGAVFTAYRDHLPEVAPYLPDVAEIRVLAREEQGERVVLHNLWRSGREIPSFARSILKPDMLCWDDFATWDASTQRCHWRLVFRAFPEALRCEGSTSLRVLDAARTEVLLEGELEIDLRKVRGVPSFLAGRVGMVESLIVSLVQPNLEAMNAGIGRYLDARR